MFQGLRGKMNQHLGQFKVNHEIIFLTTVKELKQKGDQKDLEIKELEQKGEQRNLEIEELKKKNDEKDLTLNGLKHDFDELKIEFNQLTTSIKDNEKQTKTRFDEMKENQTQQSNKIDDLETFADRCSRIHFTLSEEFLRTNIHYNSTLFQNDYDKDEDVEEWNKIVKEVNEDENECAYLEKLQKSVNRYQETIYNPSYRKRLVNFCVFTPDLVLRCNEFIKVGCHKDIKHIRVKSYQYLANFSSEIEKLNEEKTFKIQNDEVCSFCIGNCLHVYLYSGLKRKIYLLP